VAKNKDPYKNIQRRFIEARAEDKGWEELTVEQRQRLANRFDVLAATVEGRGKIARTVLPPDVDPARRRAFRQRIKHNLPTRSRNPITQSNIDTPQVDDLNKGIPAPWNAPNLNFRPGSKGTYVPPATQTTTQSTSKANARRQVTGEFGSTYQPASWVNYWADVDIPVVSDVLFSRGIPVLRTVRQGSRELDEAYMAFKQGEIKEGLKNVAGVGRELAFGYFDATLARGAAVGGWKIGVRAVPRLLRTGLGRTAARTATGTARFVDEVALGGLGQSLIKRFRGNKVTTVNETPPVASTTERVVASGPEVRQPTVGPKPTRPAAPKSKAAPKPRAAPKKAGPIKKPTDVVTVTEPSTSSPTKPPEVVAETPVHVAGTTPPTEFQKTISPAEFTEPAALPPGAVDIIRLQSILAAGKTPKAAGKTPKGRKKSQQADIQVTPIEPAHGSPASREVVGGATPKVTEKSSSPEQTKNLPSASESKKSPSATSTGQSPPAVEQRPTPTMAEPKSGQTKSQSSSTQTSGEPEVVSTGKRKNKKTKVMPDEVPEVVYREPVLNPTTGKPLINPRNGQIVERIVYKSQAVSRAEAEAARVARRDAHMAEIAERRATVVTNPDGSPATPSPRKTEPTIVVENLEVTKLADVPEWQQLAEEVGLRVEKEKVYLERVDLVDERSWLERASHAEKVSAEVDPGHWVQARWTHRTGKFKNRPQEGGAYIAEFPIELEGGGFHWHSVDRPKPRRDDPGIRLAQRHRAATAKKRKLDETRAQRRAERQAELAQQQPSQEASLPQVAITTSKKKKPARGKNAPITPEELAEATARQLPPDVVRRNRLAEAQAARESKARLRARQTATETFIIRRRAGKTGMETPAPVSVSVRTRRAERLLAKAEFERKGRYPKDPTVPLHTQHGRGAPESGSKHDPYYENAPVLGPEDYLAAKPRRRSTTGHGGREAVAEKPFDYSQLTVPEPPKGVEFFQFDPRKFDYSELLEAEARIKAAGFEPQIRRTPHGPELYYHKPAGGTTWDPNAPAPAASYNRMLGIGKGALKHKGRTPMPRAEYDAMSSEIRQLRSDVVRSTEISRQELIRLIKSTSGKRKK